MAFYSFDTDHAEAWGVDEAIFLQNLIFWLRRNKSEDHNRVYSETLQEERYWSYNTLKALRKLFPFWTENQIRTVIASLKKQEVIVVEHLCEDARDRTQWFALVDESLLELEDETPGTNASVKKHKSKTGNPQPHSASAANAPEDSTNGVVRKPKYYKRAYPIRSNSYPSLPPPEGENRPLKQQLQIPEHLVDVVFELRSWGISEKDAVEFAQLRGVQQCRLAMVAVDKNPKIKTKPGWIADALRKGHALGKIPREWAFNSPGEIDAAIEIYGREPVITEMRRRLKEQIDSGDMRHVERRRRIVEMLAEGRGAAETLTEASKPSQEDQERE